ncbi:ankyrin repeat domain-containing protein [Sphingobacterium sp. SYP-B4668]|uniref:ankyrin repeat domain-containing protein n=1 Tax=Sphingobacterium sp. SYP-B4668 TaxID=2996035 RepID=UPI0022DD8A15|nr:ankyrin repeat domain-containing protein [Sphingobacterium sp. SYP-B4668]
MSLSVLEEYIETGNHQDLELLLRNEPELVKQNTSHDISPLMLACYYNKGQIVQTILKYITSITIHEACAAGLTQHVEAIILKRPDIVDEISTQGFSPLGIAAHFSREDIVRILLKNHADPNITSQNGYNVSPLHASLHANQSEISKMLIEAGANVNIIQSSKITPLHLASQHGNIDMIILLLENGADIGIRNDMGLTASDLAAAKGYKEIAEILRVD